MTRRALVAVAGGAVLAGRAGPALASEGGGASDLVYPILNLLLLVAVLVYFARQPIRRFFAERRDGIRGELKRAAELRAEATARYAEWQRKLIGLDAEIAEIRAASRDRTERERERMLEEARAAAERMLADAREAVQQELRRAREQLREEAADLAIGLAAERLRGEVTGADRNRLLDEFIERIERPSGPEGASGPPSPGRAGNGRS